MADPIYEKIMADLEAKIDSVTVANGFEYSLTSDRNRPGLGNRVRDAFVVIMLGEAEAIELAPTQRRGYMHRYDLLIYPIQHETDATAWQTKGMRMAADITKKLMEDHTRASNAIDTFPEPPSSIMDNEANVTGMRLPVFVHYRYDVTDPYSQT